MVTRSVCCTVLVTNLVEYRLGFSEWFRENEMNACAVLHTYSLCC